jgi:hypothetical protein
MTGIVAALLIVGALPGVAPAQELHTVTVTIRQGRLDPETLEVPASTRFKIVIRNAGPGPAEFESRALRVEKVLAPGATSFVVVAPQKPGVYDMFDEFHPDAGKGRIVVK